MAKEKYTKEDLQRDIEDIYRRYGLLEEYKEFEGKGE